MALQVVWEYTALAMNGIQRAISQLASWISFMASTVSHTTQNKDEYYYYY